MARRVTWRLFARKDVGETRQREKVAKLLAGAAETEPNADPYRQELQAGQRVDRIGIGFCDVSDVAHRVALAAGQLAHVVAQRLDVGA